jgi:hypothetical protein
MTTKHQHLASPSSEPTIEYRHFVLDHDGRGNFFTSTRDRSMREWKHHGDGLSFETAIAAALSWKGDFDFTLRLVDEFAGPYDPDVTTMKRPLNLLCKDVCGVWSQFNIDRVIRPMGIQTGNIGKWFAEWVEENIRRARHETRWNTLVNDLQIRNAPGLFEAMSAANAA